MITKNLIVWMCVAGVVISTHDILAQGRGNAYGHDKQEWRKDDRNSPREDHRFDNRHNRRDEWNAHRHDRYSRKGDYHRPPHWSAAYGYHNQPRYVYYRDYNVYYDCYLGQFITFSGRNYIYSYHMPPHLRRANFDRIVFVDLDYYDDDLPKYLDRRRGSVSVNGRF